MKSVVLADLSELQGRIEVDESGTPIFLTGGRHQAVLAKNGVPVTAFQITGLRYRAEPISDYVERFDDFKHLVMLYDDKQLARKVEFRYIQRGLEKHEMCEYVIPADDPETPGSIKAQMEEFGIDVDHYVREDCLRVIRIRDPAKNPEGFNAGCRAILDSLLLEAKLPVRMVLHIRYRLNDESELENHASFEKFIEENFDEFPGSMLCNHYVGNYRTNRENDAWTRHMLETHDTMFVASLDPRPSFFQTILN